MAPECVDVSPASTIHPGAMKETRVPLGRNLRPFSLQRNGVKDYFWGENTLLSGNDSQGVAI